MRADFYPDLMASPVWPLTEGSGSSSLLFATTRCARPSPGRRPRSASTWSRRWSSGCLADAAREPGVLPLLQETMALLWQRRARRLLTLEAYQRLGSDGKSGLATALATWADAAYAELDPARRAIARRVLLRLVQLGQGRDDTRRQQPVTALRPAAGDPAEFEATLDHLTRHRLLTLSGGEPDQDTSRADLAHEALITAWPALRRWVDEDREGLRVRAQLADDAQVWAGLNRHPDSLYRGIRLAAATQWAAAHPGELTTDEREFLAAAERRQAAELTEARAQAASQARAARRLRWSAAALSVLLVLATLAGVLAVRSAGEERKQARIANSRSLANQATATAGTEPDLSILLSVAAYNSSDTAEARASLQSQLLRRRHVRRILTTPEGPLTSVAFSADGRVLAAGAADGRVHVWEGDGQQPLATLGPAAGPVRAVAVSPDGRTVAASAGHDPGVGPGRPRPAPATRRRRPGRPARLHPGRPAAVGRPGRRDPGLGPARRPAHAARHRRPGGGDGGPARRPHPVPGQEGRLPVGPGRPAGVELPAQRGERRAASPSARAGAPSPSAPAASGSP